MSWTSEVPIHATPLENYRGVVSDDTLDGAVEMAAALRTQLSGRVIWNINSTAAGGGVAEMLHRLVGYGRGVGFDSRWLVVSGDEGFFKITKRLHNALHGDTGDGSGLAEPERAHYESIVAANYSELAEVVNARDLVILHDPQTAGLIPHLLPLGAFIVWRCHVGCDDQNEQSDLGWGFLEPYIKQAHVAVFSRREYVPAYLRNHDVRLIPPNIDPFSPKNQDLSPAAVHAIVSHAGIIHDGVDGRERVFTRGDGTPRRVESKVAVIRTGDAPGEDTPIVTQVSRWDRLKDPIGVMEGFVRFCEQSADTLTPAPHLLLAGPRCEAVSDDPEGLEVFDEVVDAWGRLPHAVRNRVHIVSIPMDDLEENAAIVNALQRHSAVIVQKSLKEGFGLTVTEAMWKARPVIATAVGGIQDQIEDQRSGVLMKDATDTQEFADALAWIFADPQRATDIGNAARERVRSEFLGLGSLMSWGEVLGSAQ